MFTGYGDNNTTSGREMNGDLPEKPEVLAMKMIMKYFFQTETEMKNAHHPYNGNGADTIHPVCAERKKRKEYL
jgi:hypothetical protein